MFRRTQALTLLAGLMTTEVARDRFLPTGAALALAAVDVLHVLLQLALLATGYGISAPSLGLRRCVVGRDISHCGPH